MKLSVDSLIKEAENFCAEMENRNHPELTGINDGKTIGTFIEHEFREYLKDRYEFTLGSSASGIDFPDADINTDLKVTSSKKPQNSCPFEDVKQKIYGLGYNLLLIIYTKKDVGNRCVLTFESCTFIESDETGDYNLTKNLRKMVENRWSKEKIAYYLRESKLPGDEDTLERLAEEIIHNPPKQGYLTISNAFQWRLKYTHKDKKENRPLAKKEYGDYQTPLKFARKVMNAAREYLSISPDMIIEPTCGIGNFIKASRIFYPDCPIIGVDINEEYLDEIRGEVNNLTVYNENIFSFDFDKIINDKTKEYLIVGNPPWATNTELSKLESDNLPVKENIKNLDFFESVTGMSNFDISENIILHIINRFKDLNCSIVFLCKYSVACNVFEYLVSREVALSSVNIVKFNSMKVFRADTTACILMLRFSDDNQILHSCRVDDLDNTDESYHIGMVDGKLYSNIDNMIDIDGECPFEWRQGVKHDCTSILELNVEGNHYMNNLGEVVSVEDDLLYPLLKSSNLKNAVVAETGKCILMTQRRLREDTGVIRDRYPLTWDYLEKNREYFEKRKSSIYERAPRYGIFGIGDYAFRKYKVAISGFYKRGLFCLVYSDKTMMLDDTCYYLSFDDYDTAYVTMLVLNSWLVKNFLKSIVFVDAKRPYTKKILKRVDIVKALEILSFEDLRDTERELDLDSYVSVEIFRDYLVNVKK